MDTGVEGGPDVGTSPRTDGSNTVADVAPDLKETGDLPPPPDTRPDAPVETPVDTQGLPDVSSSVPDVPADRPVEVSQPTYDGGLGLSCIKGLFGTYVMRWDGILIDESSPTSPQTVFEASTGTPLAGVLDMQQGSYHGCAVLANGTVECWQTNTSSGNQYGQLGNGTTTTVAVLFRATPVLTAASTPLANAVALVPGLATNSSCAVTTDSKLWCWGNLAWLVNKGTALATGYAQAITTDGAAPLTGVISAALGRTQACALVAGTPNAVWCWGLNGDGALGQGDTTTRQYPTKVVGLSNPTAIALAPNSNNATVCALEGENVKCWGQNNYGQAGVNVATDPILSPTTVVVESGAVLDGVSQIVPGGASFAVLRSTATMWTWGYGDQKYASNFGQTNVLAIGWAGPSLNGNNGPRFLTSDGVYHNDTSIVTVNCNAM
jgi:alpha-tubulin suppressor-like RCC1 family protein